MSTGSQPRHRTPTRLKTFLFGTDYYPEQWTDQDRYNDATQMAAASVNTVRMGEFAWNLIAPSEGKYDFSFFDRQIELLSQYGVGTILGTPTAAPPAWLTRAHPEALRIDIEGRRMEHGTRQHCCTTSPVFRRYSQAITSALAEHFATNANVIGWQIDNELNYHFSLCCCPECQRAFRQWCRRKYKDDVAALSAAWGGVFWSTGYGDFEEVQLPFNRPANRNPGQMLDHRRFVSDAAGEFLRQQVEILRSANPGWFIMHNGLVHHVDYTAWARDLDFLGADIYPRGEDPYAVAFSGDRCRAVAGNFLVPELQSGACGQGTTISTTPPPGQMRLWAYQAIAHGADGVLHNHWRTCRFGAEEYWCGIIDHDNKPRRRFEEFAREGNELRHFGPQILGTSVDIEAGVLVEYDQDFAHEGLSLGMPPPADQAHQAHHELWRRKLPVGLVDAGDRFDGLRLLVVPGLMMLDEELVGRLSAFVKAGGVLLATAWTGTRDRHNRVTPMSPPGLLADLIGATVEEFGRLDENENYLNFVSGTVAPGWRWYDALAVHTAQPVATWDRRHYHGTPAMTVKRVGQGRAFYVGTYLSPHNCRFIMNEVLEDVELRPWLRGLPEPVEATRRSGNGYSLLFLLNHSGDPQTIPALPRGKDLVTTENVGPGPLTLGGKEAAIIRLG